MWYLLGQGLERFQQVLEDQLSRTGSLLSSLVMAAGGRFAQPGDVAIS